MIRAQVLPPTPEDSKILRLEISGHDLFDLKILLDRALSHTMHDYPKYVELSDKLSEFLRS